ncbi:unnamed protein product [Auanema sp. JU1783]|nr:unnamed protein product [Auanema sp. JU1783]
MVTKRVIWLVRHGERIDNINPDWKTTAKRWDDPPLSERGVVQAGEVGLRLLQEDISHAICSPFTRCVQTITEILNYRKNKPKILIEPGLGESLNACNDPPGRPVLEEILEITQNVDTSYAPVFSVLPPEQGGDAGCSSRIEYTVLKLLERFPTGNILLVSHGSPIAASHLALMGSWNYVGLCTIGKEIRI